MEEPGDDFFEVTQEDLHRMMAGSNRGRASEGQGLKTAKMREQESQQKAARLGPVPIRLQLPDGLTVQVRASRMALRVLILIRPVFPCIRCAVLYFLQLVGGQSGP